MYFISRCLYNSCHNNNLLCQKKKKQKTQTTQTFFSFSICFSRTTVLSMASTSTLSSFSRRYLFTPTMTSDPEGRTTVAHQGLTSTHFVCFGYQVGY